MLPGELSGISGNNFVGISPVHLSFAYLAAQTILS